YGRPEDVAGMALFLASDYASFISGASIDIAGGMGGQIAYFPTLKRDFAESIRQRRENFSRTEGALDRIRCRWRDTAFSGPASMNEELLKGAGCFVQDCDCSPQQAQLQGCHGGG